MGNKVLIVNSSRAYSNMFSSEGWEVVDSIEEATLVQFTGGEDVSPSYYHESVHPSSHVNPIRDREEKAVFDMVVAQGKPITGICRGGQFVNVMNGGEMWQHVDNHAVYGTHEALDEGTKEKFQVSSTHHQMMRPSEKAVVVATARLTTFKEKMVEGEKHTVLPDEFTKDVEVVYYPETNSLCFQPHPEFDNVKECRDAYFNYIDNYLFDGELKCVD